MDLLSSLFPNDPAYEGLLSVDRVKSLQRNALLRAGIGLLGDTTGANPMQTGPALAKNLGPAIQNFPQEMSGAAEAAGRMRAFDQSEQLRTSRRQIIESNPKQQGESEVDWLQRLYPEFVKIGDTEIVSRLTQLLSSVQRQTQTPEGQPHAGINPATGKPEQFLVDRQGNVKWLGIAPNVDSSAKDALTLQHETLRAMPLVSHYDAETKDLRAAHLYGQQGLQQANAAVAGDPASQYALFHAFLKLNDPQAVVRPGTAQLVSEAMSMYQKLNRWTQSYLEGKSALMDASFTRQVARVTAMQVRDLERRWNDEYKRTITRAKLAQVPDGYFEPPDMTPEEFIGPWAPKAPQRSAACQHDITKC